MVFTSTYHYIYPVSHFETANGPGSTTFKTHFLNRTLNNNTHYDY